MTNKDLHILCAHLDDFEISCCGYLFKHYNRYENIYLHLATHNNYKEPITINNLEEFTINAGLIINNRPVAGLINAPAKKRMFYSFEKGNAFELSNSKKTNLSNLPVKKSENLKFISYSTKIKPEIQKIYDDLGVKENGRMKSSLKFCVVATSEYDLYVAEPRACEWDIAAGHAILENAGGIITDFSGNEIFYCKKDFKNSSLILKREKNL